MRDFIRIGGICQLFCPSGYFKFEDQCATCP